MKINCSVCLSYYKETSQSSNFTRTRYKNSSLSLVINPRNKDDAFLIYQTAQNNGHKYKVVDNIATVFTKYVNEGKSTIRLKIPAVDICIQSCESVQLKCFLQSLKHILLKDIKSLKLATVSSSTAVPQLPKKKLVIKGLETYNVLRTFPRTLEHVMINNVMLSRIDSRILKLQNLKILSLECNAIESLPEDVGRLSISELYLGFNRLGSNPHSSYWKWMTGSAIRKNLKVLHLESNELQNLPYYLIRLKSLTTLKIDNNSITGLPICIGRLPHLSYLSLCNNKLKYVPSTLQSLKLSYLDVYYNEFEDARRLTNCYKQSHFNNLVPSLLECSALKVSSHRIRYKEEDIPLDLQDYLDSLSQCTCHRSTTHTYPVGYQSLKKLIRSVDVLNDSSSNPAIYKFNYCSFMCYRRQLSKIY